MAQQVVFQRVPAGPVDGPETPGVAEAQAGTIAEQNINVVMFVCRDCRIQDTEAAGHAQVQDDATAFQIKNKIFRAPSHCTDLPADELISQ